MCAVPAASRAGVRAVTAGPLAEPDLPMTMSTGRNGTVVRGKQADVRLKSKASPRTGLDRALSASMAAAPSAAGGAAGGRPIRMRAAPSALNDFVHQAGVKPPAASVPSGKMCDTCKVNPATHPDSLRGEWNCAACQFQEPP